MKKRINIAVIGHLDHGKSTLIGRLLYDTKTISREKIEEIMKIRKNKEELDFSLFLDSFQEEREGQFTLDTTQVIVKTKKFEYNFIDCPGHKEFIQNMLTGASQGEWAVLVVSAKRDEGIQKHTKLHINLAKLLGIKRLLVVVNKMDTVDYRKERFLKLKSKIEDYLKIIDYRRKISFIPLSAKYGENVIKKSLFMKWYKNRPLLETLNAEIEDLNCTTKKAEPLRLSIQAVYNDGYRKVVLGKIEKGRLKVNDKVFMNLSQEKGIVKEILNPDKRKKVSQKGECVSFIVKGVNLDEIKRGEVVTNLYSRLLLVKKIKAEVFFLKKKPKNNTRFLVKCGLQEVNGEVKLLSGKEEIYKANIFLEEPLAIESVKKTHGLGRFILIDNRRSNIVGLGKIDV